MKALIFAAGLGTRLRPITDTIPKALVPVAGVPMLERVIRKLQAAGVDSFVVNAHHFASQIVDFVEKNKGFGSEVALSVEQGEPLETGGGIMNARALLEGGGRFLVHNADILSNADIRGFMDSADPSALATLMVTDIPADRRLLFDEQMRMVGWTNVRTGEVRSPYPGLDVSKCRSLSFCGIHVISDRIFSFQEDWPAKFSITDLYISLCGQQLIRGVEVGDIGLIDIGSPEKLAEADRFLSLSKDYFTK